MMFESKPPFICSFPGQPTPDAERMWTLSAIKIDAYRAHSRSFYPAFAPFAMVIVEAPPLDPDDSGLDL